MAWSTADIGAYKAAAGGGGHTITVPTGSLTLTGTAPDSVNSGDVAITRSPDPGTLTLTGKLPTLDLTVNHIRGPPKGALTLAGLAPTASTTANHITQPEVGSLTLAGLAPALSLNTNLSVDIGSLALTGYAPVVINGFIITDVDGDESVTDGQTGVVISLAGEGISATGKRVFIHQGGAYIEQVVTGEDASSITITVGFGGLPDGPATLCVWDPV